MASPLFYLFSQLLLSKLTYHTPFPMPSIPISSLLNPLSSLHLLFYSIFRTTLTPSISFINCLSCTCTSLVSVSTLCVLNLTFFAPLLWSQTLFELCSLLPPLQLSLLMFPLQLLLFLTPSFYNAVLNSLAFPYFFRQGPIITTYCLYLLILFLLTCLLFIDTHTCVPKIKPLTTWIHHHPHNFYFF